MNTENEPSKSTCSYNTTSSFDVLHDTVNHVHHMIAWYQNVHDGVVQSTCMMSKDLPMIFVQWMPMIATLRRIFRESETMQSRINYLRVDKYKVHGAHFWINEQRADLDSAQQHRAHTARRICCLSTSLQQSVQSWNSQRLPCTQIMPTRHEALTLPVAREGYVYMYTTYMYETDDLHSCMILFFDGSDRELSEHTSDITPIQ